MDPLKDFLSNPEALVIVAGAVISGLMTFLSWLPVPAVKTFLARLDDDQKRLLMVGAVIGVALGTFGANCWGWMADYLPSVACTQAGFERVLVTILLGISANQGVFMVTPRGKKKAAQAAPANAQPHFVVLKDE